MPGPATHEDAIASKVILDEASLDETIIAETSVQDAVVEEARQVDGACRCGR